MPDEIAQQDANDAHGRSTLSSAAEGRLKNPLLRRAVWNTRKMKKKDKNIEKKRRVTGT